MESAALSESFSEPVCSCVLTALNRDNEISLKASTDNLCGCDLLAEDDGRSALGDESPELGEEVARVFVSAPFAGTAKRLAGTASSPNGNIIWPSGETQCEWPASDAGEEMCLRGSFDILARYLLDRSPVDRALGDQAGGHQPFEPVDGERIVFVVVVHPCLFAE